jgi:hypothetical protein
MLAIKTCLAGVGVSAVVVIIVVTSLPVMTVNAQSVDSPQNVTSSILKNAREDFSRAIEAMDNNDVTGAVNEARSGMFYLEMLGIPNNCLIDDNEMLQCGFPR